MWSGLSQAKAPPREKPILQRRPPHMVFFSNQWIGELPDEAGLIEGDIKTTIRDREFPGQYGSFDTGREDKTTVIDATPWALSPQGAKTPGPLADGETGM